MKKEHIPGCCAPLAGFALCGRWAHYETGDHELLRRLALADYRTGDAQHLCSRCVKKLVASRCATVDHYAGDDRDQT